MVLDPRHPGARLHGPCHPGLPPPGDGQRTLARRSARGREYHRSGAPMRPRALLTVSLLLAACAARRVADAPAPSAAPATAATPKPASVPEAGAPFAHPSSAEVFEGTVRPLLART